MRTMVSLVYTKSSNSSVPSCEPQAVLTLRGTSACTVLPHARFSCSTISFSVVSASCLLSSFSGAKPAIQNCTACQNEGTTMFLPLPIFATTLFANSVTGGSRSEGFPRLFVATPPTVKYDVVTFVGWRNCSSADIAPDTCFRKALAAPYGFNPGMESSPVMEPIKTSSTGPPARRSFGRRARVSSQGKMALRYSSENRVSSGMASNL